MNCPICGKDVELKNKQVGVDEQGNPVFNQYAVCKHCKKQWNLDKKRTKKASEKKSSSNQDTSKAAPVKKANLEKQAPAKKTAPVKQDPVKKANPEKQAPVKKANPEKQTPVKKANPEKQTPVKKANPEKQAPVKKVNPEKQAPVKKVNPEKQAPVKKTTHKPVAKKAPVKTTSGESSHVKKAARPDSVKKAAMKTAQKKSDVHDNTITKKVNDKIIAMDSEHKLGNIPSEKVRAKRERVVKQGYEEMLAADSKSTARKVQKTKVPANQPAPKTKKIEMDNNDYEPIVRFRALRVIFGIISILIAGFYAFNSYSAGLLESTTGMTFLLLTGWMIVAGLLLIILNATNNIFAFLLPMILYLASGLYAFFNRGDDTFLLYSAIIGAAFSVLFIILAISSRGDEEDYENFDEDEDEDDDDDWDYEDDEDDDF